MGERGDAAQNGGPPDRAKKKRASKLRPTDLAAADRVRGAAKTIVEGRRNEQIYMERLAGRSVRALALQFDLSQRQVHDIVKHCREAAIDLLELNTPWRAHRFAEEHLMRLDESINGARELELRARQPVSGGCSL